MYLCLWSTTAQRNIFSLNTHNLSDYNYKSRQDNRCTNKSDNLNSEEMYEWQSIRENKLQFLLVVSWQLDYTPYTVSHCKPFKIPCLCTPLTYLTTFRTFGRIHSSSRRITARQNSRIRKVSDMQPYVSNRTHKSVVTKPQALTLTTQQSARKNQPNPHSRVPNVTAIFQTKLVVYL